MTERTPVLTSRLPQVGTTIFSVMSALAAEHGAGWQVMGAVKRALDPLNLMNPGKLVPGQA